MVVAISRTANPAGMDSSLTSNNVSIGAEDPNRIVVACVGTELTNGQPNTATIDYGLGAIAMSAGTLRTQGIVNSRIFYLPVPSGTTANLAFNLGTGTHNANTNYIAVYRVVGGMFDSESGVADTDADPISSGAITIPTSGGCIAICSDATDTTARTWTGITMDIDADAGTFRFSTGFSTSAGTPTITVSGGNNEDGTLAWIIFKNLRRKVMVLS